MRRALAGLALSLALAGCQQPASAGEAVRLAPAASRIADEPKGLKTALFAGGCYWGVEGVFSHVKGVKSAVSGFHGGAASTAEYDRIGRGDTGHAETVRVVYDPAMVRYDQLLRIFFSVVADPTTLNRQGPDAGTQYRSALVPLSDEQRVVGAAYLAQLGASKVWKAPIVTRIEPYKRFHAGPAAHQDFMAVNPRHPYILRWDVAKVEALQRMFPSHYQPRFTKG
jgi:peptide-methionine (S)-S-oxide reductase